MTAYAYDDQLRRLKSGMQVKMRFADSSRDFKGVIDSINPIPVTLQLSPLLKICGGEISAVPVAGKFNEFAPEHPLFAINITPLEEIPFQQGRTLRVLVQNRELLFDQLWSQIIYFFRSEF